MAKSAWKLWHEVVKPPKDVRSGELSLAIFAKVSDRLKLK